MFYAENAIVVSIYDESSLYHLVSRNIFFNDIVEPMLLGRLKLCVRRMMVMRAPSGHCGISAVYECLSTLGLSS